MRIVDWLMAIGDFIARLYSSKLRPFFHTFTCGYCQYPLSWKKTVNKQFAVIIYPQYYTISFYECKTCKYSLVSYNNGVSNVEYFSTENYLICKTQRAIELYSSSSQTGIKTLTAYSEHLDFSSANALEKKINTILLLSSD